MGLKKFLLFSGLLISAFLPAIAQRDSISLTTIVTKAEKLPAEHPFEKVYLHFDKPYYAVGDTIWFKAYLTVGPLHQPSGISRIIYVDVLSSQDSVVTSLKIPTVNGVGFGDINISPYLYKEGNYHIRAFTNWMRNFDPDYFFRKTITIGDANNDNTVEPRITFTKIKKGNETAVGAKMLFKDQNGNLLTDKKISWAIQNDDETVIKGKGVTDKNGYFLVNFSTGHLSASADPSLTTIMEVGKKQVTDKFPLKSQLATADVQFFPEGGEFVSGVRSKVAFKAINSEGIGVDVSGSIVDNAGNEVAAFTAQHGGMGIFALTPEDGKTYKAAVTFPDGSKITYDLPNIQSEGINLAVNNNDPDNLNIKIATNGSFFKKYQNRGFYIVAESGGVIYYTGLATLQSLVYTASVPKSKFPTGILQVTLLEANGEPLSERIVFIQRNDALNLALTTNLPSYGTKQNVKMTFTAKNKLVPVTGTFSVAVVDETKVPFDEDAETTILSSLLLTSDLRGYIEKPNYYFHHTDDKKLADLDILMLTQGYRRFSYSDILADKYPSVKFLPEQGMVISGSLRTMAGVPVFKGVINLKLPDRHISVNGGTDADGHFSFSNVSIFDSSKVVLSARNNARASNLMIMADVPSFQPITKNPFDPNAITNIDSVLNTYIQNSRKHIESLHVLKEVVIKSTKIVSDEHPVYTSLTGLNPEADQILSAEKLKNCGFDLVGCIISKVFGVTHANGNFYITRDYSSGKNMMPMQFYVNGVAIDADYLTAMKTDEIKSIEVFMKDGVSHINDFFKVNGIISITTKTGTFTPKDDTPDLGPVTVQSSEVTLTPKGYYRARVFYSPRYENANAVKQSVDLRSTIFWDPNIVPDKTGSVTFDYYNSASPGIYKAVIEGIDSDGNIGRAVLRYKVK